jgi:general L-amino acid transport system permease protein
VATHLDEEPRLREQHRPPPWRDVRVLRVVGQVVFVVAVVLLVRYLFGNLTTNLRRQGLPTGFQFLDFPAGFDIAGSDFRPSQPIREALRVGLLNTIRVSAVGILLASVIGLFVGIARLSTNWLVRKAAAFYVEAIRNTPVLLIIIFMYQAVILPLPPIARAAEVTGVAVLSNRGIFVAWGEAQEGFRQFVLLLAVGFVAAVFVGLWRTRRFDQTGAPHRRVLFGGTVLLLTALLAYAALQGPVTFTAPTREGRVVEGGIMLAETFTALLLGLVIYTASHIAEIVRGSIQAVPKGQTEAAYSIALSSFQRLRYVVLPQAMRIMIPPLASQYLNLTKNSSLGIAVAYVEVTRVTFTSIGNGNPAPQHVLILMGAYLFLSLSISLVANIINRRLQLVTR